MHLNEINSVFLDCDEDRQGLITKKKFLIQLAEQNLQFPFDFLFNLIRDLQDDSEDESEDAMLNYENLKNIIEIYNNCPTLLRGDNNNSDNFKANMDTNKDMIGSHDRLDKLFQYVHVRIEEKFKDFRHAFRSFDKNFDGSLNFKEFITGMEGIGVKLKLSDYRLIFDAIDYNNDQEIDFFKFCLLNTDRKLDLQKLKQQHLRKQELRSQQSIHHLNTYHGNMKKPPLPYLSVSGQTTQMGFTQQNLTLLESKTHKLFGDGTIPKNKDMNGFTQDIQQKTLLQSYMNSRFKKSALKQNQRTYLDMPNEHIYGKTQEKDHDIVAILTNSYQDELKRTSINELRSTIAHKNMKRIKQLQSKNTTIQIPLQQQQLRNKALKNKQIQGFNHRNHSAGSQTRNINNNITSQSFVQLNQGESKQIIPQLRLHKLKGINSKKDMKFLDRKMSLE